MLKHLHFFFLVMVQYCELVEKFNLIRKKLAGASGTKIRYSKWSRCGKRKYRYKSITNKKQIFREYNTNNKQTHRFGIAETGIGLWWQC